MQSEMCFPSRPSHQLKSYVASKSRLKLAARSVLSADAGLLVDIAIQKIKRWPFSEPQGRYSLFCFSQTINKVTFKKLQLLRHSALHPRIMWLNTVQRDLRAYNLTLNEAVDLAQNCPLWRLISTHGTIHS